MADYLNATPRDWIPDSFRRSKESNNNDKAKTNKVNQFTADVWDVLDNAGNVLLSKHKDYGPTNISLSPGGPLNGLRVRMHDKTARINHLIDNGATPENESLRDSFRSALVHLRSAVDTAHSKSPAICAKVKLS